MSQLNLTRLAEALPIHAEEGKYRESISEERLVQALSGDLQDEGGLARIDILKRIFLCLRLLDEKYLKDGKWSFVSFPAYLAGRSLVEMLDMDGCGWFKRGYWEDPTDIEQQRSLLEAMELGRVNCGKSKQARPIRFVTVAWGMIRFGNDFLLHHREDKPRGKNWVVPGGRFRLDDAPSDARIVLLRSLYGGKPLTENTWLRETLIREINEETGLVANRDYTFDDLRELNPYRKLEGDSNKISLTEYRITLFAIHLTDEGEPRLLEASSNSGKLAWFSIDELKERRRSDGKVPFIDVLFNEFDSPERLQGFLEKIPESAQIRAKSNDTDAIDIPANVGESFRKGKTGKEKEVSVELGTEELALLKVIAAHGRGLKVDAETEHLMLLGGGWVKLVSSSALACAESVRQKLEQTKMPMLQLQAGTYVRLTMNPELAYFSESSFSYSIDDHRMTVKTYLNTTPWASMGALLRGIDLDPTIELAINKASIDGLEDIDSTITGIGDFGRELREKLDRPLSAIGLRKFLRFRDGFYFTNVARTQAARSDS